MQHIRSKTLLLRYTSTTLFGSPHCSKNCHASVFDKAEEYGDKFDDYSTRRRQIRYPKKSGYGSSYSNFNVEKRFKREKNNYYKLNWQYASPEKKSKDESKIDKISMHLEKFFYVEHPDVTSRSEEDVQSFREKYNISVTGENAPKPITKFSELCLPEKLMAAVEEESYADPTPIQSQSWPVALSGRDMVGVSQTGSGKTLAYMLPAIVHAVNQNFGKSETMPCSPQILVLGPTRELIQQIYGVSGKYIHACGLSGACVYGGASKNFQLSNLQEAEICVATPGRLIDFVRNRDVSLERCSYFVLDEADRMLDMGFEPQIREIIDHLRVDRQTLMWSATWPAEIRNLSEEFLSNYVHITIGSGELTANPNIEQKFYVITENEKEELLFSLLKQILDEESKVLVFAETKRKVDYLSNILNRNRIKALGIHGDVSQNRRDSILKSFRLKGSTVLVATDVASRGLDISDIHHVLNFDFPTNIEDYIHRIGRTARGSASGVSHSFFTPENAGLLKDLFSVLKRSNQVIDPELCELFEKMKNSSVKYSNQNRIRRRFY